jgi:hypothetical protein
VEELGNQELMIGRVSRLLSCMSCDITTLQ